MYETLNNILESLMQVEGYSSIYPRVIDNRRDDGSLEVDFVLPGFDKESIMIEHADSILAVSCAKPDPENKYEYGFTKKYRIGGKYDLDKVEAEFQDGILRVVLPVKEGMSNKKVNIK